MKKKLKHVLMSAALPTSLMIVGNGTVFADESVPAETTVATSESMSSTETLATGETTEATTTAASTETNNIVSEGGHVNVEGHNATLSKDGNNVTYSYTIAFQRLHSSDNGQTVGDLAIRIPNLPNAEIKLTLVGTRDTNGNPVEVNAPMKAISYDDAISVEDETFDIPTAEELSAGKTAYTVTGNDFWIDDSKIKTYNLYTKFDKSQAVKVEVTIPLDQAVKIKYLPIDARMLWKGSFGGGIRGYESGDQHLEEYENHRGFTGSYENDIDYAGLGNPSSVDESYVSNGHLIKSVTNPRTYITPNNGDWTSIPEDTNIDSATFFDYAKIFTLRANKAVTYYMSEKEDMADQDVSALYLGDVVVDYMIKGTTTKLKDTYTDTNRTPIYDVSGNLIKYNTADNIQERPESITVDGKTYVLVGIASTSDAHEGSLKEGTTHVVYEYQLEETTTAATTEETTQSEVVAVVTEKEATKEQLPNTGVAETSSVEQLPNTGVAETSSVLSLFGFISATLGGILLRKKEK